MKEKKHLLMGIAVSLGMVILILDTKTALKGAQEAITLCLYSIIPTLLPFCVISKLINACFLGKDFPFLRPVAKACGIPKGAESLLLCGLLGGYPVGAQGVNDAYQKRAIPLQDAKRLLAFSSNAGPAFIFGMLGGMFSKSCVPWLLFGIHILSALLVGMILPTKSHSSCALPKNNSVSLHKIMEESIKTMATVCAWVILFRIILHFCQRWFLWAFPQNMQIAVTGILELANGCVALSSVENLGLRFIFASVFLGFGGVCVTLQTVSVTKDIGKSMYFSGKLLQACISALLAGAVQYLLFPLGERYLISFYYLLIFSVTIAGILLIAYKKKKVVAFAV